MEVWAWVLVDKKATEEAKEAFRVGAMRGFGPAGMLEQDDGENWVEVQKVLKGSVARKTPFCVQMGLGHERKEGPEGFRGTLNHVFAETAARGFYRHWLDLMNTDSWQQLSERRKLREQPTVAAPRASGPSVVEA